MSGNPSQGGRPRRQPLASFVGLSVGGAAFGGRDAVEPFGVLQAAALSPQLWRRGAARYHTCFSCVRGSGRAMLTLVIRVYRLGRITPFCSPISLRSGPKSCLASRPMGTSLCGSVGAWLLATVLQDSSGAGASQVSALCGVDLGSAVLLSGATCRGVWRPSRPDLDRGGLSPGELGGGNRVVTGVPRAPLAGFAPRGVLQSW